MNIYNKDREKQITDHNLIGFSVLFGIFVGAVTIAGVHGAKLVNIGPFVFDAGLLTISLTFLCTDIVSEVYGRSYSKKLVLGGLLGIITAMLFSKIALAAPADLEWNLVNEYNAILGTGNRVLFAALAAYVGGQLLDITVFTWIRNKTKGKHLWLRNNLSTLAGGLADAVLFSTIAFYGVYDLMPIIMSAYAIRIIISLVDTPFVYLGVYLFHKKYPELNK